MDYQNLFTQTQVTGPISRGVPINSYDQRERTQGVSFSGLLGRIVMRNLAPFIWGV